MRYQVISDLDVPGEIRTLASVAVMAGARWVRIADPELYFVRESISGEFEFKRRIRGFAQQRRVYVDPEVTPRALTETIMHEIQHVKQYDQHEARSSNEMAARLVSIEFLQEVKGNTPAELTRSLLNLHDTLRTHVIVRGWRGNKIEWRRDDGMKFTQEEIDQAERDWREWQLLQAQKQRKAKAR